MVALSNSAALVEGIRAVTVDPDESATFERAVAVALQEIPGAEFGGVSELTRASIRTRAASDPRVQQLDQAQYDMNEGPCITAADAEVPVITCDELGADERWPTFGRTAADFGVNSAISFALFDGREKIGALNLYARARAAFTTDAEEIGSLLAAHAAVVMAAGRKQANLTTALQTRDVIGQAKGILMERYKFDDRQAFETLIAVSQHTHRKLRDVADHLRATGELPSFD
ncbi:GAF and ANTAR domain-containing protein [Jatrophihabitans endophyticus]|uniref:ANTAR domain-containing protein n=1 Tax=Jatrophihabitans endophyticus TaxID=1206085 RepID=UPI0019F01985|nr:GAF and ANTAR domain-containing protein [Jatrophihabitans endophyticus]MBE7187030.1 GAF and ANTAR domain-containing protein [Jatrophihabitans endophyticus]